MRKGERQGERRREEKGEMRGTNGMKTERKRKNRDRSRERKRRSSFFCAFLDFPLRISSKTSRLDYPRRTSREITTILGLRGRQMIAVSHRIEDLPDLRGKSRDFVLDRSPVLPRPISRPLARYVPGCTSGTTAKCDRQHSDI